MIAQSASISNAGAAAIVIFFDEDNRALSGLEPISQREYGSNCLLHLSLSRPTGTDRFSGFEGVMNSIISFMILVRDSYHRDLCKASFSLKLPQL